MEKKMIVNFEFKRIKENLFSIEIKHVEFCCEEMKIHWLKTYVPNPYLLSGLVKWNCPFCEAKIIPKNVIVC